jgi:hypothetical protein
MSKMFDAVLQDEEALRAALAEADIAPMLMVLAQLSGDSTARTPIWRMAAAASSTPNARFAADGIEANHRLV